MSLNAAAPFPALLSVLAESVNMSDALTSPSASDEAAEARRRHQHELDAITQQVTIFVQQYTQHVQHTLLTLTLAPTQHTTTNATSTQPKPSLDDILPPPPKPKRKHTSDDDDQAPPADTDMCAEDDEVERDAYGVVIKRRRSKLPLRSVLALRAWFAEHLQAPYPTDAQRDELARQTKLSVKQVQNWFTNTRKRFWAPWVKRQQETSKLTATSEERSHDEMLMTSGSMTNVTFDGFSLQGS